MDPRTQARVEARAQVIKAMAHPPRLFIVEQLSQGERCVRSPSVDEIKRLIA